MSQLGRRVLLVPSGGEARDAAKLPRGTGRPHEEDLAENISRVWGDQPWRVGGAAEVAVGKGAALVAYDGLEAEGQDLGAPVHAPPRGC